jgi:hypothetical protein
MNRIRSSIKLDCSAGREPTPVVGDCRFSVLEFKGLGFRVPLPCDPSAGVCASRSKMMSDANPSTQPWRSRKPCAPPNRVKNLPPSSARQFKPLRADTVGCAPRSYHGALWRIALSACVQLLTLVADRSLHELDAGALLAVPVR